MTPLLAPIDTAYEVQEFVPIEANSTLSVIAPHRSASEAVHDEEPWLGQLRESYQPLRLLRDGWDGPGSKAVSIPLIYRVERALRDSLTSVREPKLPFVVPAPDGGLQIEWHQESLELEVLFSPDGSVSALLEDHAHGLEIEKDGAGALDLLSRWAARLAAEPRHETPMHDSQEGEFIPIAA
jgi:hypothetical protein